MKIPTFISVEHAKRPCITKKSGLKPEYVTAGVHQDSKTKNWMITIRLGFFLMQQIGWEMGDVMDVGISPSGRKLLIQRTRTGRGVRLTAMSGYVPPRGGSMLRIRSRDTLGMPQMKIAATECKAKVVGDGVFIHLPKWKHPKGWEPRQFAGIVPAPRNLRARYV